MTRLWIGAVGLLVLAVAGMSGQAAAQDKRVVVYSAAKSSAVDTLVPLFEKASGIKVDVVKGGSGDLVRRLGAEAARPAADVIWSVGAEQLEDVKPLLQPYKPVEADKLIPAFAISDTWLPYNGVVVVFAVNTLDVKPAGYPRSWKDLADPKWKGKISSARADSSGSAFQQLATVLIAHGDQGWELYKGMLRNFVLSKSSGTVVRFVNDGEAQVGVTFEDNALDFVRNGGNVAIVYPADGSSAIADGMALVKGGPNPEAGKRFLDFLLSKPSQELVVKELGRRPVRIDVEATKEVPPLSQVKLVDYDIRAVGAKRLEWVARWTELAAGQ